jgi:flagellar protein FlaG
METSLVSSATSTGRVLANKSASGASTATVSAAPAIARTETASVVQQPTSVPNMEQVKEAVQKANQTMQALSNDLEFLIDEESDRTIVRVIDQATKEVIRQMPSEEVLEIAKALDRVQGLLIRQKA